MRTIGLPAAVITAALSFGGGIWVGARQIPVSGASAANLTTIGRLSDSLDCGKGDQAACDRSLATDQARCSSGDSQGCVLLGITYDVGKKVPKNTAAALDQFQKACDLDDANGCWYLGSSFEQGRGVPRDYAKALAAYQKGCELGGDVNACDSLGVLYQYGRGVPKDDARALEIYQSACVRYAGSGFPCEHAKALQNK